MNNHNKENTLPLMYSLLLLVGCFLVAFFSQLSSLVNVWYTNEDYSHAFLIIPISIWLAWKKKDDIAKIDHSSSPVELVIVIISIFTYLFGEFTEILTLSSFAIVLSIWGIVIYLYGLSTAKTVTFSLFFLLFIIPIPSQIYASLTIPLQLLVTKTSTMILSFTRIPVYSEGNVIYIPNATFQVVNACSGLRSMISLLAISALFGYLLLKTRVSQYLLFFSGIPISVIVNIFRVTIICLLSYFWELDVVDGPVHTILGIMVFVTAFLLLFLFGEVLSWMEKIKIKEY